LKDITNFSEEVIKKSYSIPVLVDFWARWCSACKVLSPTLEILKERHKEEWILAKVEVDDHPEIAIKYAITKIPSVKLFFEGEIVDEFSGALPGHLIEEWLGIALPPKHLSDLHKAIEFIRQGQEQKAEEVLLSVLKNEPNNKEAKVLLAKAIVFSKPSEALSLVKGIEILGPSGDIIDSIRTITTMLTRYRNSNELPDSPAKACFLEAVSALFAHDLETTLHKLIESIRVDKMYLNGFAKEACIALFNYLGESNDLTIKYRHILGRILF
jgi:putative thioredoxin